jgi:hypothetical protein
MSEARINKEYLLRMSGVALFMAAVCVWALYDGHTAWPRKNLEYARVRPALLATNLTAKAWLAAAGEGRRTPLDAAFAAENLKTPARLIRSIDEARSPENIDAKQLELYRERERKVLREIFEEPLYSPADLQGQFVMAGLAALASLLILCAFAPRIRRVYRAGAEGLHGSGFGAEPIRYEDIASMDWKLWDKKGIVKLFRRDGRRHVLDCWHFSGMKSVVESVVEHRPDLAPPGAAKEGL